MFKHLTIKCNVLYQPPVGLNYLFSSAFERGMLTLVEENGKGILIRELLSVKAKTTTTAKSSKINWFYKQNNSFAGASRFLVHFLEVHYTTTTSNLLIRRCREDVDIGGRTFLSLFETG